MWPLSFLIGTSLTYTICQQEKLSMGIIIIFSQAVMSKLATYDPNTKTLSDFFGSMTLGAITGTSLNILQRISQINHNVQCPYHDLNSV